MWLKDSEGNVRKLIHEKSANVYEVKSYSVADKGFTAYYHDLEETYVYGLRDGRPSVRVQDRIRSGKNMIAAYRLSNGREANALYLCEPDDPKAVITNLYAKKRPLSNVTLNRGRAWSVILTDQDVRQASSPLVSDGAFEINKKRQAYDWLYSGGTTTRASGINETHLDSSAQKIFQVNRRDVTIKVEVFRNSSFAQQQLDSDKSLIYSSGAFSTKPVSFPACGDDAFGSQWGGFAPDYVCKLDNYLVEVSVGDFGSTRDSRALTAAIMAVQIEKIRRITK